VGRGTRERAGRRGWREARGWRAGPARHAVARLAPGFSRSAVVAVAAVVGLAGAGTAAYEVAGRSAHARTPVAHPVPAPVTLSASASPAAAQYGGSVAVAAVLVDAAGVPVAGVPVDVLAARVDTPRNVAVVSTTVTDAAGRVAASFRPAASSNVWARYGGSGSLAPAVSLVSRVDVVQKVTASATARVAGAGRWTVTVRGTVTPARAGEQVRVERRVGAAWAPVAVKSLTAAGTFAFSQVRTRAGTYEYRVRRPADASFGESSAVARVRLRAVAGARPPAPLIGSGRDAGPRLLVTGDSLAYYLGQQLATARRGRATVVDSKHSSGLARPDYFDWEPYARQQVAAHHPTSVVLYLGGNDCQPLRRNGTGAWTAVGTSGWSAEYQRRVASLMRVYTGAGARVYWLGLPIARDPEIASCYRMLNAASAAAARSVAGVAWRETWSLYTVDGHYSDVVNGVLARQEDGIHLTFEGTRFATRMVLALLGA
jgi:hypothetical protein